MVGIGKRGGKNMKKIIGFLLLSVVLSGCSNSQSSSENENQAKSEDTVSKTQESSTTKLEKVIQEEKQYYSYLDGADLSNVETLNTTSFMSYDPEVPKQIQGIATHIFLARVTSLDAAINWQQDGEKGSEAFTLGKLEILENIEGEAEKEVSFARYGGYIKVKDFYKNGYPEEIAKVNFGRQKAGLPTVQNDESYMEVLEEGDIHLEAGEVYLFFAYLDEETSRYILVGFQHGSLGLEENGEPVEEVELEATDEVVVSEKWEVKNESDGETADLAEYLETELDIDVIQE